MSVNKQNTTNLQDTQKIKRYLPTFYLYRNNTNLMKMKTLAFLSAVKHFMESVTSVSMIGDSEVIPEFIVESSLHLYLITFKIPENKLTEVQRNAVIASNKYLGVESTSYMTLENWIMNNRYITGEFINSTNKLKYYAGTTKVDVTIPTPTYTHENLEVFYAIRQGFRVTEVREENTYFVTTPSGNTRNILGSQCSCKEFSIVNRSKKPCLHLKIKKAYTENRAMFFEAGIATIV